MRRLNKDAQDFRELLKKDPKEAMARSHQAAERLVSEAIRPNAEQIAEIMITGAVAVVVHAPADEAAIEGARVLGWDGKAAVFEMAPDKLAQFAKNLRRIGDSAAADWLENGEENRLFALTGHGTLCLNHEVGVGWSLAPGTDDLAPNN